MMVTWQVALTACAGFVCIVTALEKLQEIIKKSKEPSKGVNEKLDNDNKRIEKLEDELDYISKSISILMRSNLVILGHLSTNNNKGEMASMEKEIQEFLINN